MENHLPSVLKFDVLTNKQKSLGKTVPSEIKNKVKEVGVISLSTPKVSMLVNQQGISSYHHLVFILNIPHSQVTKGTDQCKKEVTKIKCTQKLKLKNLSLDKRSKQTNLSSGKNTDREFGQIAEEFGKGAEPICKVRLLTCV